MTIHRLLLLTLLFCALAAAAPHGSSDATDSVAGGGTPSPWADLGFPLPGAAGTPHLRGVGSTLPLAPYALEVTSAAANADGYLFIGFGVGNTPFLGGFMVPEFIALAPIVTDESGKLSLPGRWPPELVQVIVYLQVWLIDPTGSHGATATNGLAATAL
ncbi:MAG: hypothetical protein ACI9EF_001746 [Pseudohongiellaceae bacterium]|jgi:hypothetical protein